MRKSFFGLLAGLALLAGCVPEASFEYTDRLNAYVGEDGRQLILEDFPENEMEAVVADFYGAEITRDYSAQAAIAKWVDEETLKTEQTNAEESYHDGYYIEKYVLKEFVTVETEEFQEAEQYIPRAEETIQEKQLEEAAFVGLLFDQTWSSLERAPQWGDGEHFRLFLIGRPANGNWAIYDLSAYTSYPEVLKQ